MSISRLKTRGEVPPPVCYHSFTMDEKSCMFSFGGVQSSGENVPDPYVIDMKNFTWKPLRYTLPFEYEKHTTVFHEGFFYSYASDGYVYKFNQSGGDIVVKKLPLSDPKPIPRTEHSAVVVIADGESWMLVFGGRSSRKNMVLPDLWGFSLKTETWKRIGSLKARCGHLCHVDKSTNKVVVFGGIDSKGVFCDTVFHIDCNNNFKRTIVKCTGTKPTPRAYMGTAIFDDRICVFGGLTETGTCSDCYCLDFRTHKWHILSKKLGPFRLGHQCFVVDEFMYSFGGKSDPNNPKVSGDFLKIKIGMLVGKFAKRAEDDMKKTLVTTSKPRKEEGTEEAEEESRYPKEATPKVEARQPQQPKHEAQQPRQQVQQPQQKKHHQQPQQKKAAIPKEKMLPVAGRVAQAASKFGAMRGQRRGARRVRGGRSVRRVVRGSRGVRRVRRPRGARRPRGGRTSVRRVVRRVVRGQRRVMAGGQRGKRGGRRVRRRGRVVRRVRRVRRRGVNRPARGRVIVKDEKAEAERIKKSEEAKRKKESLLKQQEEKRERIAMMRKRADEEMKRKKEAEEMAKLSSEERERKESERRKQREVERKRQFEEEKKKREFSRKEREKQLRELEEGESGEAVSAVPAHMKEGGVVRQRAKTFKKLFSGMGIQVLPETKKFVVEVDEVSKEVEEEMEQEMESKVEIIEEHQRYSKVRRNGFKKFVMADSLLKTYLRKPKRTIAVPKPYLEYLKKKSQSVHDEEWPLKKEEPFGLTSHSLIPGIKRRSNVIQAFKDEAKEYPTINRNGFLSYCEPFRTKKVKKRERPEWYLQYKLSIGQEVQKEENFEELFNYSVTHLKPIAVNVQKKKQTKVETKKNVAKKNLQERRKKRKMENTEEVTKNFVEARLERAQNTEKLTLAQRPKRKGRARRRRTKRAVDMSALKTGT